MRNGEIDGVAGTPQRDDGAKAEQHHCQGVDPLGTLLSRVRSVRDFERVETHLRTIT